MCGCFAGSFRFSLIISTRVALCLICQAGDGKTKQARSNEKPKKKQVKPTYTGARDSDYIPDLCDGNDGDYHKVSRNVEVSKKQHRPEYIAPMSMNRLANFTRQRRAIAPNNGGKRQLALVDEDENDEISESDMEKSGLKDDVNEGRIVQCEVTSLSTTISLIRSQVQQPQ
ncbi:unnamed protein product [Lactuca virosa]|uniref:Uncharacterized protein n=1 Tax=Lactuca virosa TaxID=75947 RepID=A0AAU9PIB3_9ASTR|nr:unnamed protein product [Lactuca virosa]